MNTSSNYGFKLPESTDNVNIDDLNDNFEQIDGKVINVPQVVTGTYTGDGISPRWLTFDKPILFAYINGGQKTAFSLNDVFIEGASSGSNTAVVVEGAASSTATVKRSSNGIGISLKQIQVGSQMNVNDAKYTYMVILKGDV